MFMLLLPSNQSYPTLSYLLRKVNEYFDFYGYAVVVKCTKKSPEKIMTKTWIMCDLVRKIRISTDQEKRHNSSHHMKCDFSIIAEVKKAGIGAWMEKKDPSHSHDPSKPGAYLVLQQIARAFDVPSGISCQLIVTNASFEILSPLRSDNTDAKNLILT